MKIHSGYTMIYENLTDSSAVELQKLHDWLGIDVTENKMQGAFSGRTLGGDPKFNATSTIHVSSRYRYLQEPETDRKKPETGSRENRNPSLP